MQSRPPLLSRRLPDFEEVGPLFQAAGQPPAAEVAARVIDRLRASAAADCQARGRAARAAYHQQKRRISA